MCQTCCVVVLILVVFRNWVFTKLLRLLPASLASLLWGVSNMLADHAITAKQIMHARTHLEEAYSSSTEPVNQELSGKKVSQALPDDAGEH